MILQDPKDRDYRPITLEAHDLVFGDRQGSYGHPLDDFTCTAKMMTAYMEHRGLLMPGAELEAEDIGPFMNMVKLSRQANCRKRDNCVDGAGYWETTERVIHERARRDALNEQFLGVMLATRTSEEAAPSGVGCGPTDHVLSEEEPLTEAIRRVQAVAQGDI